jgi:branched-chain amino acid transport system permease protein
VVTDLMGVNIRKTQVTAFGLGAALAGLAGGLYAHTFSFVEIQGFNAIVSIYVLLYVLLGGTQTAWGPIVGATFFTLLPEVLREIMPTIKQTLAMMVGVTGPVAPPDESWRLVILGILTVLMMAFRPEGLVTRTMIERMHFRRRAPQVTAEVSA